MFLLSFKQNILSIAYVDWIEGMYGSNAKYKIVFKDSMEITPVSWKTTNASGKNEDRKLPFIIYAYLRNSNTLVVIFKDKKMSFRLNC